MFRVERPRPNVLVVSQRPTGAALRLAIWVGVVIIFYLVVLGDITLTSNRTDGDGAATWHTWALLLVPLCLLPYLFSLIRALRRGDELIFDGGAKRFSKGNKSLAAFEEIRALELQAVHGSCEELRLSVILSDGNNIELFVTDASAAVEKLAGEISELLQVELTRAV